MRANELYLILKNFEVKCYSCVNYFTHNNIDEKIDYISREYRAHRKAITIFYDSNIISYEMNQYLKNKIIFIRNKYIDII